MNQNDYFAYFKGLSNERDSPALYWRPNRAKCALDGGYYGTYSATPKKIWVHQKPNTQIDISLLTVCFPH